LITVLKGFCLLPSTACPLLGRIIAAASGAAQYRRSGICGGIRARGPAPP